MLTLEDCLFCGACCCNTRANQEEGYNYYIEIDNPRSHLLTRDHLRKRYVTLDEDGTPHLRLDPSGRCAGLQGTVGATVKCVIYDSRPRGCRLVNPGEPECLKMRAEKGLPPDRLPTQRRN